MLTVHGQPRRRANINITCSQKTGSGLILIEPADMEHVMKMADYVEEGFLIPIVMTDQYYNTNSKMLLSRDSLTGRGVGERRCRLDKLPVVG
jgi:hypothetical protein